MPQMAEERYNAPRWAQVKWILSDDQWHTSREIADTLGITIEASSSLLCHKIKTGEIERRKPTDGGRIEYHLIPNRSTKPLQDDRNLRGYHDSPRWDSIKAFLLAHPGWHSCKEIAIATKASQGHVSSCLSANRKKGTVITESRNNDAGDSKPMYRLPGAATNPAQPPRQLNPMHRKIPLRRYRPPTPEKLLEYLHKRPGATAKAVSIGFSPIVVGTARRALKQLVAAGKARSERPADLTQPVLYYPT